MPIAERGRKHPFPPLSSLLQCLRIKSHGSAVANVIQQSVYHLWVNRHQWDVRANLVNLFAHGDSLGCNVLDRDPQLLPRLRHNAADDGGVDVAVGEEGWLGHLMHLKMLPNIPAPDFRNHKIFNLDCLPSAAR